MFCTRCGAKIEETHNFCHSCGFETPRSTASNRGATGQPPRRLYRLIEDRKIAGVCAGLAAYMDVDVTLVRLAVITGIVVSGGLALLAYIAAWIIMPVRHVAPYPVNGARAAV